MSRTLFHLKNNYIKDIDMYSHEQNPTDNMGSSFVIKFEIEFSDGVINIYFSLYESYCLTIGDIVSALQDETVDIGLMTVDNFIEWFIDRVLNVSDNFKNNIQDVSHFFRRNMQ